MSSNKFVKYAVADLAPLNPRNPPRRPYRVCIMEHCYESQRSLCLQIFELDHIDQIGFYCEFDDVHHYSSALHGAELVPTGSLTLAECLESTMGGAYDNA